MKENEKRSLSSFEFLYEQSRYIQKRCGGFTGGGSYGALVVPCLYERAANM